MNQEVTENGKKIEQNTSNDVLVVEDSKIIQNMIKNVLGFTKYNVVLTNRGKSAIEQIKNSEPGRFKAVLLDLLMPDIDGMQVIDTIRKMKGVRSEVFVVAITGNYEGHSEEVFRKHGFNAVIHKPFDGHNIVAILDALSDPDADSWLGFFE